MGGKWLVSRCEDDAHHLLLDNYEKWLVSKCKDDAQHWLLEVKSCWFQGVKVVRTIGF